MTIYSSTNYRKIYEQHYGPIPKDSDGRTYEIHHIDGDHSNNDPSNLKCVSIQEHYDIHHSQEIGVPALLWQSEWHYHLKKQQSYPESAKIS